MHEHYLDPYLNSFESALSTLTPIFRVDGTLYTGCAPPHFDGYPSEAVTLNNAHSPCTWLGCKQILNDASKYSMPPENWRDMGKHPTFRRANLWAQAPPQKHAPGARMS